MLVCTHIQGDCVKLKKRRNYVSEQKDARCAFAVGRNIGVTWVLNIMVKMAANALKTQHFITKNIYLMTKMFLIKENSYCWKSIGQYFIFYK